MHGDVQSSCTSGLCHAFSVSQTDLSLTLSAFSALAVILGPLAAVVVIAFIAGLLLGSKRHETSAKLKSATTTSYNRPARMGDQNSQICRDF
jgi:hypothetical protein